ncbi:MAG: AMP-binding protein [Gemmatimonadetes bacterium]|nr:AMP-binding protein [Gemmatimonadota bacterium]
MLAPSLGHLLRARALSDGARVFLRFGEQAISFADADRRTDQVAVWLRTQGIQRGDRVGVMLPNGLDFPLAWLGIAKAGAVLVPLNTQYRAHDLAYTLGDAGVRLVLADPTFVPVLAACGATAYEVAAGQLAVPGQGGIGVALNAAPTGGDIAVGPDDLLNIQYTSGTTGDPKGCMLTHEYWLLLSARAARFASMTRDDVALTAQPFYYMDPQWNVGMCLAAGCSLVILPRFSASTFWRSVKATGTTFFYVLGTMPVFLLKQPPDPAVERGHRVRFVSCSGIVPQLHAAFEERWGVPWREAFGMTETGVDLVVPVDDVASVGSGAVGRPVEGKDARVVDAEGHPLGDDEVGELCVRGRGMMRGYWNKPEATAERIRDTWLHTGDLAWRDARGYYHLVGRLKDMIRRGGENISAAEVEGVLAEHPAVRAAAVMSVPDELRGEEVKAFVQRQEGAAVDPADLVAFVRDRLAAFKVPRFIEFVDDFPRTPSERVAKHQLVRDEPRRGAWDATLNAWVS